MWNLYHTVYSTSNLSPSIVKERLDCSKEKRQLSLLSLVNDQKKRMNEFQRKKSNKILMTFMNKLLSDSEKTHPRYDRGPLLTVDGLH